jgi:hypothetical protein
MGERWTAETEALVAEELLRAMVGGDPGPTARVALTALVDAGLLVTPEVRGVLDAAKAWFQFHERRLKPIGAVTTVGAALAVAVERYEHAAGEADAPATQDG